MDLLYGLALSIIVLIALSVRKRKKKKFLQDSVCPRCGTQMEDATTEEHLKKMHWNGKTYWGDFTVEHLAWECPNCGYRTEFDDENQ